MKRERNKRFRFSEMNVAISYIFAIIIFISGAIVGLAMYFGTDLRWRDGFMFWRPFLIGLGIALSVIIAAQILAMLSSKENDT